MTDSENELTNTDFNFPNVDTTVTARGPNINISNLSFRSQLTSRMYMPRNFGKQWGNESTYAPRSMYHRRDTSPMSIRSASDMRPRNFQPYYPSMSSQRSMINGRSVSPSMSMRSMDSTSSVSAADIVFAFENIKFDSRELKSIKEAYRRLMKQRARNNIEKRRNLRRILKQNRRRSGEYSGDQASGSSLSSDDDKASKAKTDMSSCRSTIVTAYKRNLVDNLSHDNTDNIKQNPFKNMFSLSSGSLPNFNNKSINQSQSNLLLKDRFKNNFLLPSQRFNKSVAEKVITEVLEKPCKNFQHLSMQTVKNHGAQNKMSQNDVSGKTDSEEDEIFSASIKDNIMSKKKNNLPKRSLDSEDENLPNNKRAKLSPPAMDMKKKKQPLKLKNSTNNDKSATSKGFEFAVPKLPIKKAKLKVQEKLLAKSTPPVVLTQNNPEKLAVPEISVPPSLQEKANVDQPQPEIESTNVSMQPSFIKRKLFTQKLDVIDKGNLSIDSTNSPKNAYNGKEKNKARKLATSQSCLNRDVQDDSNLLDLIHKIVPPDQMNATHQTMNRTTNRTTLGNKSKNDEDKWDVTSVLSTLNDDDLSDTFTDEDIFTQDQKSLKTKKDKKELDNHKNQKAVPKNNSNKNKSMNTTGSSFTEEEIFNSNATKQLNNKRKISKQMDKESDKVDPKANKNKLNNDVTVVDGYPRHKNCRVLIEQFPKIPNKIPKETMPSQPVATNKTCKTNGYIIPKNIVSKRNRLWHTDLESDIECPDPSIRTIPQVIAESGNVIHKNKVLNGNTFWDTDLDSDVEGLGPSLRTIPRAKPESGNIIPKNKVPNGNTFWDTDLESDIECLGSSLRTIPRALAEPVHTAFEKASPIQEVKEPKTCMIPKDIEMDSVKSLSNSNKNQNIDMANNFNFNFSNISVRSHRTVRKKKCCLEDVTYNPKSENNKKSANKCSKSTKPIASQNDSQNITNSRTNTRLNSSRNDSQTKLGNKPKKTKATPKKKGNSETQKNTKQNLDAKNKTVKENKPVPSILNRSRPNTRLNASIENVINSTRSKRERSADIKNCPNNNMMKDLDASKENLTLNSRSKRARSIDITNNNTDNNITKQLNTSKVHMISNNMTKRGRSTDTTKGSPNKNAPKHPQNKNKSVIEYGNVLNSRANRSTQLSKIQLFEKESPRTRSSRRIATPRRR